MLLPIENQRADALKKLAAEHYGEIGQHETDILELAASSGYAEVKELKQRFEIRGDFLRWLITDKQAVNHIDPLGIRIRNAIVSSPIDLDYCEIPFPLDFVFCTLKGGISLYFAKVPSLLLDHCTTDSTLNADGVRVAGNLALTSFQSERKLSLYGAVIGGYLNCSGAELTATDVALNAGGAKIAGTVFLTNEFSSTGAIGFAGAEIGGNLNCSGAKLNAKGEALKLEEAKVAGSVLLRNGFSSMGAIGLVGAEVNGDLDCHAADRITTLQCDKMRVGARMGYLDIAHPEEAVLVLFGANVGALHDDEKSWPRQGNIGMNGFVYQELVSHARATPDQIDANGLGDELKLDPLKRISWLRLQPDDELDNPQPWMQLAKVLGDLGDTDGAKHVVYEFQRHRARKSILRPLSFVYDQVEEQPLRVAWPIIAFWAMSSLVFWRAHRMGAMSPVNVKETEGGDNSSNPTNALVPFNPAVYALENVLPVVELGQDAVWAPNPGADGTFIPGWKWMSGVRRFAEQSKLIRWMIRLNYTRLALLRWALILVGWALALILATAIGEQFKR